MLALQQTVPEAGRQPVPKTRRRLAWLGFGRQSDPEQLYLEHLEVVERAAASVARRSGFPPEDVEDFVATVHVKLIDDDYAIVRRHRGTSKLATYLVAVVNHAFQDWRNQKWGRFRPSAQAKNLGPMAVTLERLLVRDQLDVETAIDMMRHQGGEAVSVDALRQLAAQLPYRVRRTQVGDEALQHHPAAGEGAADRAVHDAERASTAEHVQRVLAGAWGQLQPKDRLILEMFFAAGYKGSTIAEALGLEQRTLYTSKDRGIRHLRRAFAAEGLAWETVREVLAWVEPPMSPAYVPETGQPQMPSTPQRQESP